ncbi:uncharacterized protein LOC128554075 [Mercenaria mercenaria]|uniref:uncharacterized protein LOC128554075 n=1 Tax=Mercenaria mercenaria TaxID=6596 RepID=UPI00234EF8B9|nr:uncharacterized protein LOC128554075 [Mercenaria mercenaria]
MAVHVFGNSPSPAIATYALRKSVEDADEDVKSFVSNEFYVDDAFTSLPNVHEAVDLVKKTQKVLARSNIVLHKVASNKGEVVSAFSQDQLAKGFKDLDLKQDTLPTQRSLGLLWDMDKDTFLFEVSSEFKPFTRRGVISVVNSLFDPIRFLAPITIQGKLILRNLMSDTRDWDEPLPQSRLSEWVAWKDSLAQLKQVRIPRLYSHLSLGKATRVELYVFCDASEFAIAAAAYLVTHCPDQSHNTSFVIGKAKVVPASGHSIPRLELRAAVLAVQIAKLALNNLEINMNRVNYYSDSKIVLGYIHNSTRRFARYVSNRVEKIRTESLPEQWKYVPTQSNPADTGTRGISVDKIQQSMWLTGPPKSILNVICDNEESEHFPLVKPEEDTEVKREVNTLHTSVTTNTQHLGSKRFAKFSSWKKLVAALCLLMCRADKAKRNQGSFNDIVEKRELAEKLILRETQRDAYSQEYKCLTERRPLQRNSSIASLNPYVDDSGLIRVGGRLNKSADLSSNERNPVIVSGRQHVATLLVRYYHERVCHQGRHFTEGAVRAAGLWIIGSKRLVSSVIHAFVICRKSRGIFGQQKMADIPADRIKQAPPFTYVRVDMFGPWHIVSRKTRGGQANSKRWEILFTCLCVRAIHIEIVEDMTASAFLNALRWFVSIRGKVKQFRSARGTNFVGSMEDARIDAINIEERDVKKFLFESGTTWIFNAPHSSHMGGVWERMIGVTRRILENMMSKVNNLTHEVFVTLMAEVSAIVNSRPLVPVSYDNEVPEVLTPATLLTQKIATDSQPLNEINPKDLYKSQWRRVQHLADTFWTRWRRDYLCTLQSRRKCMDGGKYKCTCRGRCSTA